MTLGLHVKIQVQPEAILHQPLVHDLLHDFVRARALAVLRGLAKL